MKTKLETYTTTGGPYRHILNNYGQYISLSKDLGKLIYFHLKDVDMGENHVSFAIKETKKAGFLKKGRMYEFLGIMFITSGFLVPHLKRIYGSPIYHKEFGEGRIGELDPDYNGRMNCASYFINLGGGEYHISYDHRGMSFEPSSSIEPKNIPGQIANLASAIRGYYLEGGK